MTIQNDFPIASVLRYAIGGKVKYFLTCATQDDLVDAIKFIHAQKPKKIFVCGTGSNIIFTDEYFDGVVLHITATNVPNIHLTKDGCVESYAGELLDTLVKFSFTHKLIGLSWAGGLPGTVGAAVRGNVGAYGGEMKDHIVSAKVFDYRSENPQIRELSNKELALVYRGSVIKTQKNLIVISVKIRLEKGTENDLSRELQLYEDHIANRKAKHPLEYPNCGSVFKNLRNPQQIQQVVAHFPDLKQIIETKWYGKVSVAHLIERFGLKGYRIGNAQISEKHALFIVNLGGAKAADVVALIHKVQETFQEKLGFVPETEVEIVQ